MSWEQLKSALQRMPPTGETGFEGLVARLLSDLLDETFVLARAGDQPSGDARSLLGTISIQAKRYAESTSINVREIEGDIHAARRALPHLEVYVPVITRSATAQFQDATDAIEAETSLNIITLSFDEDAGGLPALCITFWDSISHFPELRDFGDELLGWIEEQRESPAIQRSLTILGRDIREGLRSYNKTFRSSSAFLQRRFGLAGPVLTSIGSDIDLSSAIRRPKLESAMEQWWVNPHPKAAYLQGEEGTGKSWAAALLVEHLLEASQTLVLWVDSFDWRGCYNLADVVSNAFRKMGITDERKLSILNRKVLHLWRDPILIVLDGVNEYNALDAANRVLYDFSTYTRENLRILLTTRPLKQYQSYTHEVWSKCREIPVEPFDDDEFREALRMTDESLTPEIIPESVGSIARIPRYFKTSISLRHKLGSLDNVTKEIVLWEDLKDRIQRTDPQVRQKLGWQSEEDAREILSELATKTKHLPGRAAVTVPLELLNDCFGGDYDRIRGDLIELRIAEKAQKLEAEISPHHLILGWGLYLLDLINGMPMQDIVGLAEEIKRSLEPIPHEDRRTEAIYVALQLSVLHPEKLEGKLNEARASLIYSWILSHNADVTKERLDFWLGENLEAYLLFLESLYENLYITEEKSFAIKPLAQLWLDPGASTEVIDQRFRKWLLLVWPDDTNLSEDGLCHEGHRLPIAKTPAQLRLSGEVISFLSLRPDPSFLKTLALCRATLDLSYSKDGDKKHREKYLEEKIGILMRWNFTEKVLPTLESLAEESDKLISEGARLLASDLALAKLPDALRIRRVGEGIKWNFFSAEDIIRDQKTLFPKDQDSPRCSHSDLPCLAVRMDLPDLLPRDRDIIKQKVLDICEKDNPHSREFNTSTDLDLNNYWPWFVKCFPELSADVANEMRLKALGYEDPIYLLQFLSNAAYVVHPPVRLKTVREARRFLTRANEEQSERQIRALLWMTECMLFVADEDELMAWFDFLASNELLENFTSTYDHLQAIRYFLPPSLRSHAKAKVKSVEPRGRGNDSSKRISEYQFWCMVLANTEQEDHGVYEWAKEELQARDLSGAEKHGILDLIAGSGKPFLLKDLLEETQLSDCFYESNLRILPYAVHHFGDTVSLDRSYEEYVKRFRQDWVSTLFLKAQRMGDFDRWGRELLNVAIGLARDPNLDPNSPRISSPVWWRDYDIRFFRDRAGLRIWAGKFPDEFSRIVREYSDEYLKNPRAQWCLGSISDAISSIFSENNPGVAFGTFGSIRNAWIRTTIRTQYDTLTFISDMFDVKRCDSVEHDKIRRDLLDTAKNDQELLQIALAAMHRGATDALRKMLSEEYLNNDLAKNRCLAVSVLPWFGDDDAASILRNLKEHDPSNWVRGHAEWAYETARQEKSCRESYKRALHEFDPIRLSTLLQVLKPALTRAAKVWRHQVEEEAEDRSTDPRIRAAFFSFWYHWERESSRDIIANGRKLKDYCRGERVHFVSTPKMAPWWELDW